MITGSIYCHISSRYLHTILLPEKFYQMIKLYYTLRCQWSDLQDI